MVEHLVANENVASSNLVSRSIFEASANCRGFFVTDPVPALPTGILYDLPNEHSLRYEN